MASLGTVEITLNAEELSTIMAEIAILKNRVADLEHELEQRNENERREVEG